MIYEKKNVGFIIQIELKMKPRWFGKRENTYRFLNFLFDNLEWILSQRHRILLFQLKYAATII